ncbi:unnamed protein product [Caenorhabditis angaria]|uniref:Uncharacterized protein n=1 Tax=Caenorhabditis angaria TaxID=860376 RepID=A0A9P1IFX5_9PELO|nr:unnamed protein product [Caenorhabditis angaria]
MNFCLLLLIPIFCHAIDELSDDEARAVTVSLIGETFLAPIQDIPKFYQVPYFVGQCNGTTLKLNSAEALKTFIEKERRHHVSHTPEELEKRKAETKRDGEIREKIENLKRDTHVEFDAKSLERLRETIGEVQVDELHFFATFQPEGEKFKIDFGIKYKNGRFVVTSERWEDC